MIRNCEHCHQEFQINENGRPPRFCSVRCRVKWHNNQPITVVCPDCKRETVITKAAARRQKSGRCVACANSARSGTLSSTWRGGCHQWSPGRFGKDREGLSWKVQRRLARDRDNDTCQLCGKHHPNWRPDVHHVTPFRLSQSHALPNLICYCRSCHLKEEAKVQELWGGQLSESTNTTHHSPRSSRRPSCNRCKKVFIYTNRIRLIGEEQVCPTCERQNKILQAKALREQGASESEISRVMNISSGSAHYYANGVAGPTIKRL